MPRAPLTRDQREALTGETFYRVLELDRAATDSQARTVPASLSSETPVRRWFGNEILTHTPEAINLDRAIGGALPMLAGHDTDVLIGAAEGLRIADKRLRGLLRFAEATRAPEVWNQIQEGMPLGISIGYRVDEWTESADTDDVVVTRWTLYEVSVVTVPADSTVGINRSETRTQETTAMPEPTTTTEPAGTAAQAAISNVRQIEANARTRALADERARVSAIRELFSLPGFQSEAYTELERMAIDEQLSVEDTRQELLRMAGANVSPVASRPPVQSERTLPPFSGPAGDRSPRVQAGRDEREGFQEAASNVIMVRSGMVRDRAEIERRMHQNECNGLSLVELARECLRRANVDTRGLNHTQIVGLAMTAAPTFARAGIGTISHGVADFAGILLDASQKSLMQGWTEAPETFSSWTATMNMSDFKTHNLVNLSLFGDLDVVPEQAEYKYGTFSDVKETIALRTYGKLFSISRQAIINDDLSAFTAIPMRMGRAAARMVGDEAYAVLTSNPTLNQDSLALFHTTHGNYVTSGAAPSVTTLDAGFTAMATRTDPSGATINVSPKFLIVPKALEATGRVLAAATYDPAGTAGTLKPNPFSGRVEVVADARLDAFNSQGWFLAADPSLQPTVVVGYLNGQSAPYLEQQNAWSQDGVAMKVRIDCRAAAADFRGLFYNDGA